MEYRYFTETELDVTQRVRDRKTFVFHGTQAREAAKKKANEIRSYVYDLYGQSGNKKDVEFVGYAVPK